MPVHDRWHLRRSPAPGARKCTHRLYPSKEHGVGKRWQVRVLDEDGKPLPKENFVFEVDAKNRDTELKAQVQQGTYVSKAAGKVTFEAYSTQWRKQRAHGHSTAERVERGLRIHCYEDPDGPKGRTVNDRFAIGGYSMGQLGRRVSLIRDWISGLKLEPNAALLLIGTVEAIFDAAVDDKIIPSNPLRAKSVAKPKRQPTDVIPWTPEEVEATCGGLPGRMRAMAYLGAVTGPRQGELFGLAESDIRFLKREVHYEVEVIYVGGRLCFAPLKNLRPRTVPIADNVMPILSRHIERFPPVEVTLPWSQKGNKRDGELITRKLMFTGNDGRAYYRQTVNRAWQPAWKAAGVPDRGRQNGMHVLRHSAATRWLSLGLNPAKVAAFLGDTVGVVVNTYAHWLPDDDVLGRSIMDSYLSLGAESQSASDCPTGSLEGI